MSEATTYAKLTPLRLVYPPVSNQEAEWLSRIPEVEEDWRRSDFYMIAARAEARFEGLSCDEESEELHFEFCVGDTLRSSCVLQFRQLDGVAQAGSTDLEIETGLKFIRIWRADADKTQSEPLTWFTTERLLWDRSQGRPGICGLGDYRALATYDLLYVGIAKVGDTYDRLIAKGHKARQTILSNEPQRYPGARPSDEIYLFFFMLSPLYLTTFAPDHDYTEDDFKQTCEDKRVVADAEKAFVSLLQPEYNIVKFKSYPKGADGLYESKFHRYGYLIGENIAFRTAHGEINGGWNNKTDMISNAADAIFVEGDEVRFYVSGRDFPSQDSV